MEEHAWTARNLLCSFFDYKTEKFVIAHNRTVGVLFRAVQVAVLVYLIGWVFVTKKAYQETDTSIESSVITRVEGAVLLGRDFAAARPSPARPRRLHARPDSGGPHERGARRSDPDTARPTRAPRPRAAEGDSNATQLQQPESRFLPEELLKIRQQSETKGKGAEPDSGSLRPASRDDTPLRADAEMKESKVKFRDPQTDARRFEPKEGKLKQGLDGTPPGELVSELQPDMTRDQPSVTLTSDALHGDANVWDAADYVIPPQGENVFFVVTNMIATPGQWQGVCPENPDIPGAHCSNASDCPSGEPIATGNGVRTGRCVACDETRRSCEVRAWCPVESGSTPRHPILAGAENFTVFIKNSIHFPKFSFRKHNVLENGGGGDGDGGGGDDGGGDGLQRCRYDPARAPACPIFRLGDLVRSAGARFDAIAVKGGVIGVRIAWQCDLDRPPSECMPTYAFSRLDTDAADVATGYNFRFGRYYQVNGVEHRTLMKVYGIRFDVMVHGKAGKFNIVPTMTNVGSGLALLGVGVFLCDLVLLYISKKSPFYRERKCRRETDL
uniref:P2X purinoceptor n=1 Tax=Petromyzon marinus TaxID=7757 RepID=A0AAJ7SWG7_PETMA|nr:P2X purinoceptor 5-like isoform X2 [Petromyzon marinus]